MLRRGGGTAAGRMSTGVSKVEEEALGGDGNTDTE